MLSPLTLDSFTRHNCPRCQQPLGRFHAYPLLHASQVISLTSELAPMHLHCAEEHAEDLIATVGTRCAASDSAAPAALPLRVIAVVKASPTAPSARLTRLHPEDPATSTLVLFTPETVHFHHVTLAESSQIIRPATNEEVYLYMEQATRDAMQTALPGTDEERELLRTLGLLQKRWITPERTPQETTTAP